MSLKRRLKDAARAVLPAPLLAPLRRLYLECGGGYAMPSFAQEGEDVLVLGLFGGLRRGFFVDVGAHHPKRYSNTQLLYDLGWSGINVEPNPDAHRAFVRHRRRDVNLCCGVAAREGRMEYHVMTEPALNSFDGELTRRRIAEGTARLVRTVSVPVAPLGLLLARHAPRRRIDLLSVDAEGMDLEVLGSNDWDRFRPRAVLAEVLARPGRGLDSDPVVAFLRGHGFELFAKTFRTGLFGDSGERWEAKAGE